MKESQLIIDADVVAEIVRLAEWLYPGLDYGPSASQWDKWRAEGFLSSRAVMQRMWGRGGFSQKHWTRMLDEIGLRYPSKQEMQAANAWREERIQLNPNEVEHIPLLGQHRKSTGPVGLNCIPVVRTVREWCPKRHAYLPVGEMHAFMVR